MQEMQTESRSTLGYLDNAIAAEEEKYLESGTVDIERKDSLVREITRGIQDENTVWWDSDDDPANPMNWSEKKKWANVAIMSMITFLTYVASF
jgi:hypothetical protein